MIIGTLSSLKLIIFNYIRSFFIENIQRGKETQKLLKLIMEFFKSIFKPRIYKNYNNLRFSNRDPSKLGFEIKYFKESIDKLHFKDEFFDKVFCISVIEHLPEDVAFKGIKEMVRVLKKGGFLIIILDNDGNHINPKLAGQYKKLIETSGLNLFGKSDFNKPNPEGFPGEFKVIGFILKK